jgi:enamine deaminase RidA (YjgF/YER057c/UK114 family)
LSKRVIDTDLLMQPIAHFSHAVRVGDIVHVGATAGTEPDRRLPGTATGYVDAVAQAGQMFDNLDTVLALLGSSSSDLVRIKLYLADVRDIARCEEVLKQHLGSALCPAIVGSFGFPLPQAAIELDAVALVGTSTERITVRGRPVGTAVDGRFYCTSQPLDKTGSVVDGDLSAQADAVLRQLLESISAAAMQPSDVVNLHVTAADARDLPALEAAFAALLPELRPSCAAVIAPLPDPAMRFQLEAVCIRGGGDPVSAQGATSALAFGSAAMLVGDELYISAQTGVRVDRRGFDGVEQQTRLAWQHVEALLSKVGMRLEDIIRTNNVLTDWRHYAGFNAGYGANVVVPYPPRATVLGALRDSRASMHIEAVAHRLAGQSTIVEANAHGRR